MGLFFFGIIIIVVSIVIFFKGDFLKTSANNAKMISVIGLIVGIVMFISSMIVIIDEGEVGVVLIFGKANDKHLDRGINIVLPVAQVFKYSTRTTELTQAGGNIIDARVSNGLNISIDCTVLYRIDKSKIIEIYTKRAQTLRELEEKILLTTLRTVMRNIVSKYTSEEVYSTKRDEVSTEIKSALVDEVAPLGIIMEKYYIRQIKLPEEVDKAIQMKIQSQQEAEAMQYMKQKAEQQAEIKIIEAQGLAQAQRIINSTLTPSYIQLEAIQAYKELAASPNTTFVILPTSVNGAGIPLILNATK